MTTRGFDAVLVLAHGELGRTDPCFAPGAPTAAGDARSTLGGLWSGTLANWTADTPEQPGFGALGLNRPRRSTTGRSNGTIAASRLLERVAASAQVPWLATARGSSRGTHLAICPTGLVPVQAPASRRTGSPPSSATPESSTWQEPRRSNPKAQASSRPRIFSQDCDSGVSVTGACSWLRASSRHEPLDRDLSSAAADLPEIVGHLHPQPRLGRRAKRLRQPDGHLH